MFSRYERIVNYLYNNIIKLALRFKALAQSDDFKWHQDQDKTYIIEGKITMTLMFFYNFVKYFFMNIK